ncbi:hypothetical protein A1O1_06194 [Capronia coronata CBS 617.96]|uniref:Alpha/beta hydrolase fold-3 domain-containing protein n=1 Tax=Capronia coronata CBS 617.96 TaxID=1182541 RepID=W9Y868_9EURO|nr:uncharacterized protein A1O1_06194 [Capronia coronata CBS 617.96]EXJ85825.1 hypothetical protein A1O1_06194 [Capronia coronata CBS 617.96]
MAPRTKEELDALSVIDPEIEAIVRSRPLPAPETETETSSIETRVAQLRSLESQWPVPPPVAGVKESNPKFTTRDGVNLNLFVYEPAYADPHSSTPRPLVIFFHGGGGVIGSAKSVASLAGSLVLAHGCVVVSPQYRLAPEHKFPTGVNDGWDAFVHVTSKASDLGADCSAGLVVGGVSFGAVLASVIALRAKEENRTPRITGLYFSAPSLIASSDTVPPEYKDQYRSRTDERCLSSPVLDKKTKALFDAAYGADPKSPLYRVLNVQPLSKHAGIAPKAYFQICGMDILRDDGFIYEQILAASGVETKVDVYPGAPHIFWAVFQSIKQATKWKDDTVRGVGWLLDRQ